MRAADRPVLPPPGDFITAPEAARILNLNRYTFYKWLKRSYVPHHRFGRIIRVSFQDLLTFIEHAHSQPTAAATLPSTQPAEPPPSH